MITPRHLRPHSALLALALYGSLSLPLLSSFPVAAQTRTKPANTAPNTITDLKAAIVRENQTALAAERIVARTSLPLIRGRIIRREAGSILLWGRALGDPRLSARFAPEMERDSNILVVQPDAKGSPDGRDYQGNHAFMGQRTRQSALGRTVPMYVYGKPPRSYYEAKKRMEGAQARLVTLRQTLVARFLTLSKQQVGEKLTDRERAVGEAKASLELQRFLVGRGLQAPELEARALEVQTRVAIADARAGRLSKSIEMLDALMGYKAARGRNLLPVQTNALTIADLDETGYSAANGSPTFPGAPQMYFALHPELSAALLGAWGTALPAYLNTASATQKAQALKWARTLVDNAGVVPGVPTPIEAASIEAALARLGQEEREKSD